MNDLFSNQSIGGTIYKHRELPLYVTDEFVFYRCISFCENFYGKTVSELHAGNLRSIAFLKRHLRVSEYDSENLMYGTIVDLLNRRLQMSLNIICHQPLNMLIKDPKHLNDEECRYVINTATHIDFLIYNRISKKPVLAIEVDGFHNHKPGTAQYERDRMKDHILNLYGIPFLRLPTNGSAELEKIENTLDELEKHN